MKINDASPISASPKVLSAVRIITGLLLAYHGWEVFDASVMQGYTEWDQFKGGPTFMPYLGKGAELVAGIMLILGFYTRVASALLIGTMLYICFFIGKGEFWYGDQHPFMFVLIGIIYLAYGSGPWSIDGK
jgi:putative oxidoreductase